MEIVREDENMEHGREVENGDDEEQPDNGRNYAYETVSGQLTITKCVSKEQLIEILEALDGNINELLFHYEYEDHTAKLNFTGLDDKFSHLKTLSFESCPLMDFDFTNNTVQSLSFDQSSDCSGRFRFKLPELKHLHFSFITLDQPQDFGSSVSMSPKLESLGGYKLWGLGNEAGSMYLPSATDVDFYRSDDLSKLHIYAPRLERLCLRACYGLSNIKFLTKGKSDHAQFNLPVKDHTKFKVNVINAGVHGRARKYLKEHPRVNSINWKHENGEVFDDPDSNEDDEREEWNSENEDNNCSIM